jgi:hypothetical protein
VAGYNAGRASAYGTLGGGLGSLGYYPGYYPGTTYIPGACACTAACLQLRPRVMRARLAQTEACVRMEVYS